MSRNKSRNYFKLFRGFVDSEKAAGFILIGCTIFSLIIANSSFHDAYHHFWESKIDLSIGMFKLDYSVEFWINDFLMAVFFLLVGLEIEREVYVGELSDFKKAITPAFAALGGMVVPGLIHYAFNAGTPEQAGFAIPMATDIAFALGILSLGGKHVPPSLKIFLTALAIIDDLGAILIIAIFYTSELSLLNLGISLGIFGALAIIRQLGVRNLFFYLIPGVFMWYFMLKSGIHATIAGVLLAFVTPFREPIQTNPSYKLQEWLHYPVAIFIIPIFALANTAIVFPKNIIASLTTHNALGISFGLIIGKTLGIFLFTYLIVKLGVGELYQGLNWKKLLAGCAFGGIGFTMSIFITNLAFTDADTIVSSKLSILVASIVASVTGLIVLYVSGKSKKRKFQL